MSIALRAEGVSKAYDMRFSNAAPSIRSVFGRRGTAERVPAERVRWALEDVSFEVARGRSLGLVGHNGAGKSTLLRLVSGLGRPTRGRVEADPDRASILNLASTFDLELTGLENAYTTAMIAGLSRREAKAALADIVEFSGLGEYVDAPVRTYSEGMRLRLAFSVVTFRRPALLVLDEILAVGDAEFRRQCEERIAAMQEAGTSVVLASHSLEEIAETCQDALWLHGGRVRAYGSADAVLASYVDAVRDETVARTPVGAPQEPGGLVLGEDRFGSQEVTIERVLLNGMPPAQAPKLASGAPLAVRVSLAAHAGPVDEPILSVALRRAADERTVLDLNNRSDRATLGARIERAEVELRIERLDLPGGEYLVDVGVFEPSWRHAYDFHSGAYSLAVEGGEAGQGVLLPPRSWRVV